MVYPKEGDLGEQGWRSGESARLPPMWPGCNSRRRRHIWVEFVVGSLPCSERFFSGYSGFPLSSKTNTSKFQFDLERTKTSCVVGKQTIYNFYFLLHLYHHRTQGVILGFQNEVLPMPYWKTTRPWGEVALTFYNGVEGTIYAKMQYLEPVFERSKFCAGTHALMLWHPADATDET